MAQGEIAKFRRVVWAHYRAHGRHDLPWRRTRDPYKILVSEVMLQQTQVERVAPFYRDFVRKFPTAKKLAAAPLSEVLRAWQGLGYNRRAKHLHAAAKEIAAHGMPKGAAELEALPGVGKYTARAVAAFAWNEGGILIETNIRTAVIHNFFSKRTNASKRRTSMIYHTSPRKISDAEIEKILARALPLGRAREWHFALMDYGAHLKRSGVRLNARSRAYAKQARFAGSLREARGAILRELAKDAQTSARLTGLLGDARVEQAREALRALVAERLVVKHKALFALAD